MKKERITDALLISYINAQIKDENQELLRYGITIKNKIIVDSSSLSTNISIHFEECIFLGKFTFFGNNFLYDVFFKRCYFLKGLSFLDIKHSKRIILSDCRVLENFIVSGNLDHLIAYSANFQKFILGEKTTVNKVEIGGVKDSLIDSIIILNDNFVKKIQIANCKIREIHFSNLAEDTEIFNCSINSLCFNKVRNSGNLKLLNCKALFLKNKISHIVCNESNLSKAEFFQFDFSSFDVVNIINSVLNDCLFVNTTWSNNIKSLSDDQLKNYLKNKLSYSKSLKETAQQLKDKKEVYKQIKYALSKQGDWVNEEMFHALEMNTYNLILDNSPKYFTTKLILYLSRLSSNYGQSLLRPILFLIIVNGLFFCILNYTNGSHLIPLSRITIDRVIDVISKFVWYLNPFHKSDELTRIPLIMDVFIRIVSSYSIYNIVRATRRFIR